jgi:hypothetical protein
MDKHKTKVIFRKFKDGDIIALFPELQADMSRGNCQSYQHVGQHGAASYDLVNNTKPATKEECANLAAELTSIGYNLDVKRRINKRWYEVDN